MRSTLLDRLTSGGEFSERESGRSWTALSFASFDCGAHKTETVPWRSFFKSMNEGHVFQVRHHFGFTTICGPWYLSNDTWRQVAVWPSPFVRESRIFFGIQWGGWYFVYNTQPFGWKISPFVYHSTGLVVSNFIWSIGISCSLYIDDRHNGQLQIPPNQWAYANLANLDEHNLTAAKSAIFW